MIRLRQRGAARARHGGFTLLELVVSSVVLSVIMAGLGSAMLIAGRALPEAGSAAMAAVAAADAAEQMTADLRYATAVSERSATIIEFTVPDRNGDGTPEVIRYAWSGTAGAPLTRRYNGATAVEILANVAEFALSYDVKTISTETPQLNESPETLLIDYTSSTDYYDYPVAQTQWYGEYFLPALPANTVHWKVTRVRFQAMQAETVSAPSAPMEKTTLKGTAAMASTTSSTSTSTGDAAGETRVQIQRATTGGFPSGVAIEEKTLYESALSSSYLQCEETFTQVSGLAPREGLCLVFKWVSDAEACRLLGRNRNVAATNLSLAETTGQGTSWTKLSGQSLLFSVYGTVTTAGTPLIQNTYYLDAVQIQLRAGGDGQSFVQTAAGTVNRPEVSL